MADHLGPAINRQHRGVVLGGDCSILIENALALRRRGRYGLAFLGGHSDFRHPRNSALISAAAGEDVAIVTGRGDARMTGLEGLVRYVRAEEIHLLGFRPTDEYLDELKELDFRMTTSEALPLTDETNCYAMHCVLRSSPDPGTESTRQDSTTVFQTGTPAS